jgi:transcriptional regulator with XRE-family HTH domain
MGLGKNIRVNRRRLGLTQAELGEKIGVSSQAVSQWELEKDTPSRENLIAVSRLFKITIDTLTMQNSQRPGIINSFDPDTPSEDVEPGYDPSISSVGERTGITPGAIPEFDLRAGASYGGGYASVTEIRGKNGRSYASEIVRAEWTFPENWLKGEMRLSYLTTDVLPVDGPSMSPDLESGDRVLIDRSNRDPKQDAIFAIRDGHSIIIKHVQLVRGSEPPRIICRSSNPKYDPFELILDGQQADIIGRVAGRISKL